MSDVLRSGAVSHVTDEPGYDRVEPTWEEATDAVRDAERAWREVMGDRLERERQEEARIAAERPRPSRFLK